MNESNSNIELSEKNQIAENAHGIIAFMYDLEVCKDSPVAMGIDLESQRIRKRMGMRDAQFKTAVTSALGGL